MININDLKKIINECCNDVVFIYNGKESGITSEVKDSIPMFQAWHGSEIKEYYNVDEVIEDKFYSGKSIIELVEVVEFDFA